MPVIRIEPGKLGVTLRADARNLPRVIRRGMKRGAQRGRTHLVRNSPVDLGVLKNAWDIEEHDFTGGLWLELVNSTLYAGVVERGMRPGFKMSRAGIEALAGWVKRKILGGAIKATKRTTISTGAVASDIDAEAHRIAYAIAKKFERVGRKGQFFVRDSMGKLTVFAMDEIMREVNKYFDSGGGSRGNVQP